MTESEYSSPLVVLIVHLELTFPCTLTHTFTLSLKTCQSCKETGKVIVSESEDSVNDTVIA